MGTGYSQNDEERCIVEYFSGHSPARFLDVGAHDGVHLSNTRRLSELGWGGTLVEPSPSPFKSLMENYAGCDSVNLVNAAIVAGWPRLLKFYDSRGDFVSTFDEAHRALWAAAGADGRAGVKFQPIYVYGINFETLLTAFPGPYAFVSLDVEGINHLLFAELPLREIGVELVCVEYQDQLAAIEQRAAEQGYRRRHVTSENVILERVG